MKSDKPATIAKTILAHLKNTNQTDLLAQVVDVLKASPEYKKSRHKVVVTSATALTATELTLLKKYLDQKLGSDYLFDQAVEPELVAGFTLEINDTFIDASILGKIKDISNKLIVKDNV